MHQLFGSFPSHLGLSFAAIQHLLRPQTCQHVPIVLPATTAVAPPPIANTAGVGVVVCKLHTFAGWVGMQSAASVTPALLASLYGVSVDQFATGFPYQ